MQLAAGSPRDIGISREAVGEAGLQSLIPVEGDGKHLALSSFRVDVVATLDALLLPAVRFEQSAEAGAGDGFHGWLDRDVQDLDIGFGPAALFLHDFEHALHGLANVAHKLVDGFALGIATGQGGNLGPVATFGFFVDDDRVFGHVVILA